MSKSITLFLEIKPCPQERIRFHFRGFGRKRQILPYLPEKTRDFQNTLRSMVRQYMEETGALEYSKDVPISLEMDIFLGPPKKMPKGRIFPTVRPDLSNYLKAIEDGIQRAAKEDKDPALLEDDSSVCEIICRKQYCTAEYPNPGILLTIKEIT